MSELPETSTGELMAVDHPRLVRLVAVRCKCTKVFFKAHGNTGTQFVTMDVNNATPFEDAEELREKFTRNYPFELEFVSLPNK